MVRNDRPGPPSRCTALVALSLAGCTGWIGPAGAPTATPPDDGGTVLRPDASMPPVTAGTHTIRRLTHGEYERTVRDLLRIPDATPSGGFPSEANGDGFANNAAALTVSPLLAEGYLNAAEVLATQAVTDLSRIVPCAPDDGGCARTFVTGFGRRAYRRPLRDEEIERLVALFETGRTGSDFAAGVRAVVRTVLQSPYFLYRIDFGTSATGTTPGTVALTGYEVASRLSYLFWGTMPDDALFAAADADALRTAEQVTAQARRLLADPRAKPAIANFFLEWFGVASLEAVDKSTSVYRFFTEPMRAILPQETAAFVQHVLWEADGTLDTLLTAPVTFATSALEPYYGTRVRGFTTFTRIELDPTQRAGILTQPSVLSVFAAPNGSDPVLRGKLVRERLLCQALPPPPPDVMAVVPEPDPSTTTRQRFEQHRTDPACAGCHRLLDPIGFGFEHFDGVGRYRATDGTFPVDSTGMLSETEDADGAFDGVPELARRLAASNEVRRCATRQWFRYAFGRGERAADAVSIERMYEAFAASRYDLRELMVSTTGTGAFLNR